MTSGQTILIVEDEPLVAMLIEDLVLEAGCRVVGPASTLQQALDFVAKGGFDAALLDVNLAGREVYPVAERLRAAGVPFVFVTGGGQFEEPVSFRGHPTIRKPFRPHTFWRDVVAGLKTQPPRPAAA